MKKLSLLTAAMLCCSLAFAQEAEEEGTVLQIIPRVDAYPFEGHLYSLFEGGIGSSDFTYSIQGHWFSTDDGWDGSGYLYKDAFFRTGYSTFIDWAYVNYAPGAFDFTVGKNMMAFGTYEEDEYDFDSFWQLNSTMWSTLNIYQWGARAGWTSESGNTYLAAELSTSPLGDYANDGLFAGSLLWRGEYGFYKPLMSVNYMQGIGRDVTALALGNQFDLGLVTANLDCTWLSGDNMFVNASVMFEPFDGLSVMAKAGYDKMSSFWGLDDRTFGGVNVQYRPLEDLRVHVTAALDSWDGASLTAGVTYFFDLAKYLK